MGGLTLGIDASNIRAGGGLKHLVELLRHSSAHIENFERIVLWVPESLAQLYGEQKRLEVVGVRAFEKGLIRRFLWRILKMKPYVKKHCDVLFVPGGISLNAGVPEVVMSQNMQPFMREERVREGIGKARLRLEALKVLQGRSFKRACAVLFLSDYAKDCLGSTLPSRVETAVIPHGIDEEFRVHKPKIGLATPANILYVSTLNTYKHQLEVVDAVELLHRRGHRIALQLVGGGLEPYMTAVLKKIKKVNEKADCQLVTYEGQKSFSDLPSVYQSADVFLFASTCENLPNILLEAMASWKPIVCSNVRPMTDVLKGAGLYFDAKCPVQIADALAQMLEDKRKREQFAADGRTLSMEYSWDICAQKTFKLIQAAAHKKLENIYE